MSRFFQELVGVALPQVVAILLVAVIRQVLEEEVDRPKVTLQHQEVAVEGDLQITR